MLRLRSKGSQDRLLLRIYELTRRFVLDMVLARQEIDDVVQEIAADCLIRLRELRWHYEPRDFELFIRVLVWNHIQKRRGRRRIRKEYDLEHFAARSHTPPEWLNPDRSLDEEAIDALQTELTTRVPWQHTVAWSLVRRLGMSQAEAAEQLGVTRATLNNYVSAAHKVFRAELESRGLIDRKPRRQRRSRRRGLDPATQTAGSEVGTPCSVTETLVSVGEGDSSSAELPSAISNGLCLIADTGCSTARSVCSEPAIVCSFVEAARSSANESSIRASVASNRVA